MLVASESILEKEICFVSPPKWRAVASFSRSHIKISAGAVTDIMNKLVGSSPVVLEGVFAVLGLREGEVPFSGRLEASELVDLVLGQQSAVVVSDVGVAASAV